SRKEAASGKMTMPPVSQSMRTRVGPRKVHASAARSGTADTATRALGCLLAGSVRDGWGVVYQHAQRFPHGKPGDLFGWDRHRVTRFWVASGARLAAPEPEAPKSTQFHFVPGTQGVGDALQEQIDHRFGLVPRELNRCCHLIHEPCLRHARTSPPRGGHSSMLDHGREG